MKMLWFLSFLFVGCAQAAPREAVLTLKITIPVESWVAGEPIEATFSLQNVSSEVLEVPFATSFLKAPAYRLRIEGPLRNDCALTPREPSPPAPTPHRTMHPGERVEGRYLLRNLRVVDPGPYVLWIEYDSEALPGDWSAIHPFKGKIVSEKIRFQIRTATGDDAGVLKERGDSCLRLPLEDERAAGIRERYPTSVFTGWILLKRGRLLEKDAHALTEGLRARALTASTEPAERRLKEVRAGRRKNAEEHLGALRAYLKARADFSMAEEMQLEVGYLFAYLEKHAESRQVLEKLLADRKTSDRIRARANAVMSELTPNHPAESLGGAVEAASPGGR